MAAIIQLRFYRVLSGLPLWGARHPTFMACWIPAHLLLVWPSPSPTGRITHGLARSISATLSGYFRSSRGLPLKHNLGTVLWNPPSAFFLFTLFPHSFSSFFLFTLPSHPSSSPCLHTLPPHSSPSLFLLTLLFHSSSSLILLIVLPHPSSSPLLLILTCILLPTWSFLHTWQVTKILVPCFAEFQPLGRLILIKTVLCII